MWHRRLVPSLEPLRADHADAVLAFERRNRAYFAASISDRGDAYFDHFRQRFRDLLAEQQAGRSRYYVLTGAGGEVLGRFNLYDLDGGVATVGYRLAQEVAGRGLATGALRELCAVAAGLGLHTLVAATSDQNLASRRVLMKCGFVPVGRADPAELGGKHGTRYRRRLTGADQEESEPRVDDGGPDR